MNVIFSDRHLSRMRTFATPEKIACIRHATVSELDDIVRRSVQRPVSAAPHTWQTMLPYLRRCCEVIQVELARCAEAFSPTAWLWYLRRLPRPVFADSTGDDDLRHQGLAVIASGRSHMVDRDPELAYEIDDTVLRQIVQLLGTVYVLAQLRSAIVLVGCGVAFSFRSDGFAFPAAHISPDIQEALDLFRTRTERSSRFLRRAGTIVASEIPLINSDNTSLLVVPAMTVPDQHRYAPGYMVIHIPVPGHESTVVEVVPRYRPATMSLQELGALTADRHVTGAVWQPATGAVLLLLMLATDYASTTAVAYQHFVEVCSYGYVAVPEDHFRAVATAAIVATRRRVQAIVPGADVPATVEALLTTVESDRGELSSLCHGPLIRRAGPTLLIDLHTATSKLETLLEYPKDTGERANARSAHFDDSVQRAIDVSPWSPPEDLRRQRKITLRHRGRDITDFDAIGAKDDVLLIVSCKSIIFSTAYADGDHQAIRAARTTVEEAVEYWAEKWAHFETYPVGDNYDLQPSRYKRIIAVVCVPQAIYVPIGPATREIAPGLRAAVTFTELREWLGL